MAKKKAKRKPISKKEIARRKKARSRKTRLLLLALLGIMAVSAVMLAIVLKKDYELRDENDPVATITLENGKEIVIELYADKAPETVANFIDLANSGFYDGLCFHRVIAGERIQSGDPTGEGLGTAGYCIRGEFSLNGFENDLSHERGTVSMARLDGYDTGSSQFFLCVGDMPYLDGAYAAFGKVVKGMEEADRIAAEATDEKHKPLTEQKIRSIRVDTKEFSYDFEKIGGN